MGEKKNLEVNKSRVYFTCYQAKLLKNDDYILHQNSVFLRTNIPLLITTRVFSAKGFWVNLASAYDG